MSSKRVGLAIAAGAGAIALAGCTSATDAVVAPSPTGTPGASVAPAAADASASPSAIETKGPNAVRGMAKGTWAGISNSGTAPISVRLALRNHPLAGTWQTLTGSDRTWFLERQMPGVPVTGIHGEFKFGSADVVAFSVDTPAGGDPLVVIGQDSHSFPAGSPSWKATVHTSHGDRTVDVTRTKDSVHGPATDEFEIKTT